jgi:predicted TPR repeat methyltransferase
VAGGDRRGVSEDRDHRAWNERAWAKLVSGEPEIAVEYARRAHELSRRNVQYLNTLGVAHAESGEPALALAAFRKALKLKPVNVDALVNLGKVHERHGDFAAAAAAYERAFALSPSFPNRAVTLARNRRHVGRAAEAKALLESSARVVDPQDLAIALADCDFELDGELAAIDRLRTAVSEHAQWHLARGALGHLLLATAHWQEGWRLYRPRQTAPLARDLSGRKILVRGEQGIGDVLFFLRFVPELRRRGAAVALACEKKLHSILSPGPVLDEIREDAGEGILVGDLPLVLESEDTPPPWPLQARERADLAQFGPPPYLGVTWRAGSDLARRREIGQDQGALMKAIAPALVGKALRGCAGTVIVLQRGARAGEAKQFADELHGRSQDLSHLSEDLPALLGVLAALDEYVGVSNANVHFVAGLGKTARVLVPYPGEWRWMRRPGPSPWFPDFKVYRQLQNREWRAPLDELRADLFASRGKR